MDKQDQNPQKVNNSGNNFFNTLFLLIIFVSCLFFLMQPIYRYVNRPGAYPTPTPEPTGEPFMRACSTEVKICPDGTAVGRMGPLCEFEPCPVTK